MKRSEEKFQEQLFKAKSVYLIYKYKLLEKLKQRNNLVEKYNNNEEKQLISPYLFFGDSDRAMYGRSTNPLCKKDGENKVGSKKKIQYIENVVKAVTCALPSDYTVIEKGSIFFSNDDFSEI
jgi:hypothetical protein